MRSNVSLKMNIEIREAVELDFDFAFEAKRQAMGPHIISKWVWDEDYQLAAHKQRWEEKPWFVIEMDDRPIGTVSIHRLEHYVRFGEFYLLSEFQNKGIGTAILQRFLKECDDRSEAAVLEYLKWSPVGSLYKRNGFKITHENEIHFFMKREPHTTKTKG